jgi:hypothetical protein
VEARRPSSYLSPAGTPLTRAQYAVVLHASRVPGFVPAATKKAAPLCAAEVALASMHARGMPRPVPASGVAHDAPGGWRREGEMNRTWAALVLDADAGMAMAYSPGVLPG